MKRAYQKCLYILLSFIVTLINCVPIFAASIIPPITYCAHCADIGWMNRVGNEEIAGTTGQNRRMEAFIIYLPKDGKSAVKYRAHVSDLGWLDWKSSGETAGTTGQARQLECLQIKLVGEYAQQYDIYYRVHSSNLGWLGWAKNGEMAGTTGGAVQAEAFQVKIVRKGTKVQSDGASYINYTKNQKSSSSGSSSNILNEVQSNWDAVKGRKSSWSGKCPAVVYWQLYNRRLVADADPSVSYGYQMARNYAAMRFTSTGHSFFGYECSKSSSAATLDRIISDFGGSPENIIVSFDSGNGLSSAGHVMLISRIENGTCYFVDNTQYCKGSDGQYHAIAMSLSDYKKKYLGNWSANYMTVVR